ncbi:MAG: class I SAM-dependent RNA methyltransferase [Phycisphaerales bacterium]
MLDRLRDIHVTCSPGLVPYLVHEIQELGMPAEPIAGTVVRTEGIWPDTWRLCLELRTAFQVLYPLASFPCDSPQTLYHQVRKIAWDQVIPPRGYITIESRVDHPSINNSMFPNLRVKDAICDELLKIRGERPDSGSEKRGLTIFLLWRGDRATIALNAAGRKLTDRGYRRMPHRAPLRESLAAAMVMESGWYGQGPLVLPMCGSGTLAIEAALMALDRAPGSVRPHFGFERALGFDEELWSGMRHESRKRARRTIDAQIIASDIDPAAIEAARHNAQTAGVENLIEFRVEDFEATPIPEPGESGGVLIVNPEYGERLGNLDELHETYARLGDFFKQRCGGYQCHVLSGDAGLSQSIGLRASRRVPLWNAEIECRLLQYDVWAGSRDE